MKTGFTLVELSIVLVIIGLLIGGILAAQNMINTAKIQGVVRQLQQYDVAVANFQTKYGQLPGDSNLFTGLGDNNNQIGTYGEIGSFWADLSLGVNLLNSKSSNYQNINLGSNSPTEINCPEFNLEHNPNGRPCLLATYVSFAGTYGLPATVGSKNYYYYDIAIPPGAFFSGGGYTRSTLKTSDALAIDSKMDDGLWSSGKVMSGGGGCASGYRVGQDNSYGCEMYFEIGSTGVNTNN